MLFLLSWSGAERDPQAGHSLSFEVWVLGWTLRMVLVQWGVWEATSPSLFSCSLLSALPVASQGEQTKDGEFFWVRDEAFLVLECRGHRGAGVVVLLGAAPLGLGLWFPFTLSELLETSQALGALTELLLDWRQSADEVIVRLRVGAGPLRLEEVDTAFTDTDCVVQLPGASISPEPCSMFDFSVSHSGLSPPLCL